jgi:hypothetical protein
MVVETSKNTVSLSPSNFCPKLLPILVIGNDPARAAQVSSALAQKRSYLAVVDEPRIHLPDADNEYVRRHNAAARAQAKYIVFVDVNDEIVSAIDLPANRVVRVNQLADLYSYGSGLALRAEDHMDWGSKNIGIGLLKALRAGKILRIIPDGPDDAEVPTESGHFVVCEDHNELATVQAANYAYSLGAGLRIIPAVTKTESDRILEELYNINNAKIGEVLSPTSRLEKIVAEMREFIGDLPATAHSLTFVTSGVPWGFGYAERPSTHLITYPDLGIHLVNAIAAEQPGKPAVRVATVIEPGQVNAAEVDVVIDSLCSHHTIVREYRGEHATVRTVSEAIELFPYDLLFISSHCGDTSGWRWTYNFKDSEGKDRELVVDVAASFAPQPGEDLINVTTYNVFVSLDGVDWHDPERAKKLVVGTAINDWTKLTQDPDGLEPTKKIEIPRVYGSAAIKVHDHQLLVTPSQLASHNTPIVINNACVSWHRLAKTFVFMNARAYLGTLFEVSDAEALDIVKLLFTKYFDRPLSVALWHAQNSVYGSSARRPYILSGPHFQRIRTVSGSKVDYLGRSLTRLRSEYIERRRTGKVPEKFLKDWEEHIKFFEYEIDALLNKRSDFSRRPSSAKPAIDEARLILD